ncbi:MAG TPA: hypothetical protein VM242_03410 [Acidimicrobiales bacterium]|jgi:hypothetical protein|nr:hypothetical protein [Acidimicrobiales bacterium]
MTENPAREVVEQLTHLLEQATDATKPVLPRISGAVAAGAYYETLLRVLVGQARDKGHTWEELADVFVTTPLGVKSRFDTYRSYAGEELPD